MPSCAKRGRRPGLSSSIARVSKLEHEVTTLQTIYSYSSHGCNHHCCERLVQFLRDEPRSHCFGSDLSTSDKTFASYIICHMLLVSNDVHKLYGTRRRDRQRSRTATWAENLELHSPMRRQDVFNVTSQDCNITFHPVQQNNETTHHVHSAGRHGHRSQWHPCQP